MFCLYQGVVKDRLSSWLSLQTLTDLGGIIGKILNFGTDQGILSKKIPPTKKRYIDHNYLRGGGSSTCWNATPHPQKLPLFWGRFTSIWIKILTWYGGEVSLNRQVSIENLSQEWGWRGWECCWRRGWRTVAGLHWISNKILYYTLIPWVAHTSCTICCHHDCCYVSCACLFSDIMYISESTGSYKIIARFLVPIWKFYLLFLSLFIKQV